ncbi:MAG: hypothetical protein OEU26_35715, partial [Candidatus Tectomicrobia bacterium]|nr:hypothetical protein [Candidatus Tectomicrobia bacterium]
LLPLVFTFAGAAISSLSMLLSARITSRNNLKQLSVKLDHETEKDKREALRNRLEELYSIVSKWSVGFMADNLNYRKVMVGDLTGKC